MQHSYCCDGKTKICVTFASNTQQEEKRKANKIIAKLCVRDLVVIFTCKYMKNFMKTVAMHWAAYSNVSQS